MNVSRYDERCQGMTEQEEQADRLMRAERAVAKKLNEERSDDLNYVGILSIPYDKIPDFLKNFLFLLTRQTILPN